MKKLILIFIFFPVTIFAQQIIIKYPGYTCYYNPLTLIPDSVIWFTKPHKIAVNREPGFHSLDGRPNLNRDYIHSGFDKGHNCNAEDENADSTDEYNSFDYANTFPQDTSCNRHTFYYLERNVRLLSKKYGPIKNKTSWAGIRGYLGPDRVVIPQYCIKEIWYNGQYFKYIFPNIDTVTNHPYTFYKAQK